MMPIQRSLVLLILVMALSRCAQMTTAPLPDLHHGGWKSGSTTKREVCQRVGQPADVLHQDETHSTWLYLSVHVQDRGVTFVPIIGLFAGGSTIDVQRLTLLFEGDIFVATEQTSDQRFVQLWDQAATMRQSTVQEQAHVEHEMAAIGLPFDPHAWKVAERALKLRRVPVQEE
jgi:hypothetical protein